MFRAKEELCLRSPGEIHHHLRIVEKCDSCSTIMTIVCTDGGKVSRSPIRYILILYAFCCRQHQVQLILILLFIQHLQPSIPPLPVARKRPDQSSGNHASKAVFEILDVLISSVIRQRSTETIWLVRPHVTSLSGNVRLAPAGTCWRTFRVASLMYFSGVKARHFFSNADDAIETWANARYETISAQNEGNILAMKGLDDLASARSRNLATGSLYVPWEGTAVH